MTRYCHIGFAQGRTPCMCGHEDRAMKEAWEGQGGTQPNEDVI